ncbi:hypothetical protein [Leeuwenhoekiella sp. LLG6367-2.1]|uniref:hypothetical protein n=1 Tax=Leeuwenhoekiella sp. LLG6367-2.1 TaxID=3160833 RepID=UPI0038686D20
MKTTISKKTIELYKIRGEHGIYADISIDDSGNNAGRIQIASDYGSWENYWGACATSFKQFLIGLDIHYTAGKFGADRWFDLDATIESLKDQIKDYTRDKLELRELNSELSSLKNCSCKEEFIAVMQGCESLMDMTNHCPDLCTDISPAFKSFWLNLWPAFINELKSEALKPANF